MGIRSTRNRLAVLIIISSLWCGMAHAAAIKALNDGTSLGYCKQIDYIGSGMSVVGQNCSYTPPGGAAAPVGAQYITQIANSTLTNEQAMSALASGLVYNTTATGVLSIATAGTDYVIPAGNVATATALAADPADCGALNFATGIAANGDLTCAVPAGFDSTLVDDTTWSDGTNAANIWTFDVTGTDHTMTAGNGLMTFSNAVTVTGTLTGTLTGNADTVTNGVYTTDFPLNQNTTGNADTATALAADPADCAAGSYTLGINASGTAQSCTDATTEIDSAILTHYGVVATTSIVGHLTDTDWDTFNNKVTESSTAGRSLTLSTYDIAADAELYTDQSGAYIEVPAVEAMDDMFSTMNALTITRIWCTTDAGTVTLNVENAADADVLSADLVCDVGGQSACGSGCDVDTIQGANDNLAAYAFADVDISAIDTAVRVSLFIGYTLDD
jgi:hypothetical protein